MLLRVLFATLAILGLACAGYLIMTPMERNEFFLTRYLGKAIFPRLDRDQQQQRLVFCAGTILAVIVCAATIYFVIKYLSRR